jgi:transcriptional regulator with XRE-family HTH domain
MLNFADQLRAYRRLHKLTQKELSFLINVSAAKIQSWECEYVSPPLRDIPKLARRMHVSEAWLAGIDREMHREPKPKIKKVDYSLNVRPEHQSFMKFAIDLHDRLQIEDKTLQALIEAIA